MEDFNTMRQRQERELLAENNPLQLYPESLDQLLERNFPPREWLIDGLLAAQAMTLLSAAPNSFKTFVMLDMALSIAQGTKLFGELETKQANVLIIDEETQDFGLYERFQKLSAPKGLPIYWLSRLGHRVTEEGYIESIVSRCAALEIGLVMVDSLSCMHNGDENTVKDMAPVMNKFKQLTDYGIAVLIIHHTRKDSADSYSPDNSVRGSSAIIAAVDSNISMRRIGSKDSVAILQTKNRFKKPHKPFKVSIVDSENEKVSLELQEWLLTDDERKVKEQSELKEAVLRVIGEQPGIYKKLLEVELPIRGVEIEERKLAALLKELVADKKIVPGKGNRTQVPYYQTDDPSVAEME